MDNIALALVLGAIVLLFAIYCIKAVRDKEGRQPRTMIAIGRDGVHQNLSTMSTSRTTTEVDSVVDLSKGPRDRPPLKAG